MDRILNKNVIRSYQKIRQKEGEERGGEERSRGKKEVGR